MISLSQYQGAPYAGLLVFRMKRRYVPRGYMSLAFDGGRIAREAGFRFLKYGGTGRHRGFSATPDFSRFALFSVWNDRPSWERFIFESAFMQMVQEQAASLWFVSLLPLHGFGAWDGQQLFEAAESRSKELHGPLGVLTRASIRLKALRDFWSHVPAVSKQLEEAQGCSYTLGFGELPWIRQATFSLWDDAESVKRFAYGDGGAHSVVVQRTRERRWYSEELFFRFAVQEARTLKNDSEEFYPVLERIA